jgi:AcrR family transcriptional regulator
LHGFSTGENRIATETRKRTRLSPEARRQQLVEIGAKIFAERSFDDVWIEEVAKAAGVSRGLVYHYFPNKQDYFSAIVLHGLQNAFEISTPDLTLPPDRWVIDSIDNLFSVAEQNADVFRAVYTSRHALDDKVIEAINAGRELQVVRICRIVTPGEEPSPTIRTAMDGWAAMLDWLLLEWLDGRVTDREQLVKIAAGSLVGTIATALVLDGNGDRIQDLRVLAPEFLSSI